MGYSSRVHELLEWSRARTAGEAVFLCLLANLVVFGAALALGAGLTRVFRRSAVAEKPGALTLAEVVLAAACVVCNSLVTLVGWLLFKAGWLRVEAEVTLLGTLADALVLLLLMDVAMYVTHRIAHVPLFFRHVHGVHHRYERVRPLTLFVLHPLEVLGFGGLWIAVLLCHAFTLSGMLLYLTLNTLFGVIGHVGVEPFPKRWLSWPVARNIGTSTFHARHHQNPDANFGFYTTLWDRLFRTLDARYQATFGRRV